MSVIYIYFTTHSPDQAFQIATEKKPLIYKNETIDRSIQTGIEPVVILGQLIAKIKGTEFEKVEVEAKNIYPSGTKPSVEDWIEGRVPGDSAWHEGTFCTQLTNDMRDALAEVSECSVERLALQWSVIEEWYGAVDIGALEKSIRDLSALSKRAQDAHNNLYVYYSS